MLLIWVSFLQGCNVAELEDKAFPVLLNIRDQDDFQNVWLNHEYAGNKEVDYNHLKVVLIERSFLEKRRKWKICYPCWSRKKRFRGTLM